MTNTHKVFNAFHKHISSFKIHANEELLFFKHVKRLFKEKKSDPLKKINNSSSESSESLNELKETLKDILEIKYILV